MWAISRGLAPFNVGEEAAELWMKTRLARHTGADIPGTAGAIPSPTTAEPSA
jgi:hypothetical protein